MHIQVNEIYIIGKLSFKISKSFLIRLNELKRLRLDYMSYWISKQRIYIIWNLCTEQLGRSDGTDCVHGWISLLGQGTFSVRNSLKKVTFL